MKPQARTDIQTLLKSLDEVEVPMDPQYYRKLHDKIMMKLDEEVPERPSMIIPMTRWREQRQTHKKY